MAQALMNDPDILFLDEPMSGLDPIGRREMKDLILALKHEGKTVFFNSHILSDAQEICDTVGIIHLGKLLKCGPVNGIVPAGKTLEEVFVETIVGSKAIKSDSVKAGDHPGIRPKTAVKSLPESKTPKPKTASASPKPAGRPRKKPSNQV
jgi:ABC-type multidrug transport system ATPase subunit